MIEIISVLLETMYIPFMHKGPLLQIIQVSRGSLSLLKVWVCLMQCNRRGGYF